MIKIEAPCGKLRGIFSEEYNIFSVRSLTPSQAARNVFARLFQEKRRERKFFF